MSANHEIIRKYLLTFGLAAGGTIVGGLVGGPIGAMAGGVAGSAGSAAGPSKTGFLVFLMKNGIRSPATIVALLAAFVAGMAWRSETPRQREAPNRT